jgi:predicted ATP-grasp superfamily ATP-dependent carboligase
VNVIVLDGNENQAVACVRSLSRAGHYVIVGASSGWSKAGWSRGCGSTFRYTAPRDNAASFVGDIVAMLRVAPKALILPMTERTTLPLSEHRAAVEAAGGRLVLPAHETVLAAFDKAATTKLAASLGLVVPRTVALATTADAEGFASSARFPVVLKPRSSQELSPSGQLRATGAPLYARTPAEFAAAFAKMRERSSAVLVQEFVGGAGAGYFALMHHGELRAEFAHRRIRDVRPTGSGSALRVSAAMDPRLREAGLAVLRALAWHGVAMVEFRVLDDGTPIFLEVNGRFWTSLPLAVYAGIDFPALLAQLSERGDIASSTQYRVGVRCRWMLGDFRHLIEVLRGPPRGFPGAFPKRLESLRDFLLPVAGTYHDNFTLRDPLPELGDWLDFVLHKVLKSDQRTKDK